MSTAMAPLIFPTTLPTLTTERLMLRALTDDAVAAVYAIFSHPEVMRYWATPPMTDQAAAQRLIARAQESFGHQESFRWGIVERQRERIIGTCSLFALDAQSLRGEVGYILGREHWGQGFANEAIAAVIDYAFAGLGLHRLEADIDPRNAASVRAVERLGFQREGLLRERWIVAGEISDSLIMGLLRREWEARRGTPGLKTQG